MEQETQPEKEKQKDKTLEQFVPLAHQRDPPHVPPSRPLPVMEFVFVFRSSCIQLFVVRLMKTPCMCNVGPALRATTGAPFSGLRRLPTFTSVP